MPCLCCARRLSGQARNRTWDLPSPSSTPSASDVPNSLSQRARPSSPAPTKQPRPSRETDVKASAKSNQNRIVPSKDSVRHVPVKSTRPTKHTQRDNSSTSSVNRKPITPNPDVPWAAHKAALKAKYPEGWRPGRKISPEAMEGIRILRRQVSHLFPLYGSKFLCRDLNSPLLNSEISSKYLPKQSDGS